MTFTLPAPTAAERNQLAKLFASIASQAGVVVMEVYESAFETRTKADYSPVSDADERAEEIILARLEEALPGVPVLAEERAAREGLAEKVAGKPMAGCVYAPARREMYFGGADARLIEAFAPGEMLREGRLLKTRAYPAEGLTAMTSSSHLDERTKAFLADH